MSLRQLLQQDNATLIITYFCLNTSMTLVNKMVAMESRHCVSSMLGATHAAVTLLGCIFYTRFKTSDSIGVADTLKASSSRSTPSPYQELKLFLFALIYMINIFLSNYSTSITTLSMWQSIRATGPLLTVLILFLFDGTSSLPHNRCVYVSLLAIVSGVVISVHGERWDATPAKLVWTFAGALTAVLKSFIQHRLPEFGIRLAPNDLLQAVLPCAVVQGLAGAFVTGEVTALIAHAPTTRFVAVFTLSAMVAFCLNVISFRAFGRVAPTSMAVAANLKQVVILFLPLHQRAVTRQVVVGTLITVMGTMWYSGLQRKEKRGAVAVEVGNKGEATC